MHISNSVLAQLENRLHYRFTDRDLLQLALTHRSADKQHNQRLEFLGDAALGFVVAEALYLRYPDSPEGELSQLRAVLVNRGTLASLARELALGEMITLGQGERKSGGRQRDSILCDAMEAVIGAVYLDGGIAACRQCILDLLETRLQHNPADGSAKDAKTVLQEMLQARGLALPVYEVLDVSGEEHAQSFSVSCSSALLAQKTTGTGRTRRLAEQHAAQQALTLLESSSLHDKG